MKALFFNLSTSPSVNNLFIDYDGKYSGLSLSRTRKGPTNLFEIEKVRDRENYRKYRNFYQ